MTTRGSLLILGLSSKRGVSVVQLCDRFLEFKREKIKVNVKIITLNLMKTCLKVIIWIVM
jgi:hypothetical protein